MAEEQGEDCVDDADIEPPFAKLMDTLAFDTAPPALRREEAGIDWSAGRGLVFSWRVRVLMSMTGNRRAGGIPQVWLRSSLDQWDSERLRRR